MTLISYAQNGEDVVLARAFDDGHQGFYIDIGASDPVVDSVTKHFYDHGWSGINVEPASLAAGELRTERPRDLTLELAISAETGQRRFYELERVMNGCSTFSRPKAEAYRSEGWEMTERDVSVTTLRALYADHADGREVDFLKIDVEGAEAEVLAGGDFSRLRPRIVVVEATLPGTSTPSHDAWEPELIEAGYILVLFDGLNRFYVRDEDRALVPRLSVPANVLDDYVPFRWWKVVADRDATHAKLDEALTEFQSVAAGAAELEKALVLARDELLLTRAELARSQAAYRDARVELDAARIALRSTLASPRPANP